MLRWDILSVSTAVNTVRSQPDLCHFETKARLEQRLKFGFCDNVLVIPIQFATLITRSVCAADFDIKLHFIKCCD